LVELRNKSKAHGALGPDFYSHWTDTYWRAIGAALDSFPFEEWGWIFLRSNTGKKGITHGTYVVGDGGVRAPEAETKDLVVKNEGLHLLLKNERRLLHLSPLVQTTYECTQFYFSNGSFNEKQSSAEFIDYGVTGKVQRRSIPEYSTPPSPRPASETEGLDTLDVHSNLWGNLPSPVSTYVPRPRLETELATRLRDRNHTIVTLHGYGGVGKTTLALQVAHQLATQNDPRFDCILWLSARDLDLTPRGPRKVRRAVSNLKTIGRAISRLIPETDDSSEALAASLRQPHRDFPNGVLFIFDNFETLDDVVGIHEFLDSHTHPPNKVLITSRERAFKADFPIEVRGMDAPEATALIHKAAIELDVEGLLSPQVTSSIFESTQGHPYLMKILVGELARARRYVALGIVLSQHEKIRDAIFERTFNGLSEDGRRVFLSTATWKSPTLEVALQSVLLPRGVDVDGGLDQCKRLSLLHEVQLADGAVALVAPPLARAFAEKKLTGDPDRLLIEEDIQLARLFGPFDVRQASKVSSDVVIDRFLRWCMTEVPLTDERRLAAIISTLEALSEIRPRVWLALAEFRKKYSWDQSAVSYALRRATEELSDNPVVWSERAKFADELGDDALKIQCLVSKAEASPQNVETLREVAWQLCDYLDQHREIPQTRRGVYLASVRELMDRVSDELDATGLSRLAWLYLLEDKQEPARRYAAEGLRKEPTNQHCQRILARL